MTAVSNDFALVTNLTSQDFSSGDVNAEQAQQFGVNLDEFLHRVFPDGADVEDIERAAKWYLSDVAPRARVFDAQMTYMRNGEYARQYQSE